MSDYVDEEFESDEDENDANESKLVKDLRRQLNAEKKARKAEAEELSQFRKASRSASVAKLIEAAGGDTRYAKFYNSDDASEDAIKSWIESESELLGVKRQETAQEPDQADQVRQAANALSGMPQGGTATSFGSHQQSLDQVNSAKDQAEFLAALQTAFPGYRR